MNRYTFNTPDGKLTRISKTKARKLWGKADMRLCPAKFAPGGPWRVDMPVFASEIASRLASEYEHEREQSAFDTYVRNFEWHNCQHNETGYYTAFYLTEKE